MDVEKIIYGLSGPIFGAVIGYISGRYAAGKAAGAFEAEVARMKEDIKENAEDMGKSFADLHERVSASKAVFTKGLDDVNTSFIQIMRETAEIKGILIGKGVINS